MPEPEIVGLRAEVAALTERLARVERDRIGLAAALRQEANAQDSNLTHGVSSGAGIRRLAKDLRDWAARAAAIGDAP